MRPVRLRLMFCAVRASDGRLVKLMWLLAGVALLLSAALPAASASFQLVNLWIPVVLQLMAIALLWRFLSGLRAGPRRRAWQVVMLGISIDVCSNITWNLADALPVKFDETVGYGFLLGYYPFAIAAGVMFYRDLGGSFRKWTTWLDCGTLLLGIGATLWLFFLRPHLLDVQAHGLLLCVLVGYALGNAMLMVMVALVAMQICDWRAERALALMMAAVTIAFVGLLGWIGSPHRDQYEVGPWFNIVGTALPYCLLALAIQLERGRTALPARLTAAGGRLDFLPVLSVLMTITLLFGEKADLHGLGRLAMLAFVLAGALLIALRQQGVRYEIGGMQRALAIQEAESRLSELVRRSSDLIALVLPGMRVAYASPAAVDVLGTAPDTLKAQPATRLLGAANEERMAQFLREVGEQRQSSAGMEADYVGPDGRSRVLRVNGSFQQYNPAIGGISLTVQDVTEELRLEREVLDIASRERARLSSDIHDGLGQELTGIALLLKSLDVEAERHRGTLTYSLQQIEHHVDDTLRLTQSLASGLSPAPTGRGTLEPMLRELAAQAQARFGFVVDCLFAPQAVDLGVAEVEHLFRIAQESLNNAARHSACRRVVVELRHTAQQIELSVSDDGCGIESRAGEGGGLGLRMIAYRARTLGGALTLGCGLSGGARVCVVVPRPGRDSTSMSTGGLR
jgi:PAS domain S-box-containing protein